MQEGLVWRQLPPLGLISIVKKDVATSLLQGKTVIDTTTAEGTATSCTSSPCRQFVVFSNVLVVMRQRDVTTTCDTSGNAMNGRDPVIGVRRAIPRNRKENT